MRSATDRLAPTIAPGAAADILGVRVHQVTMAEAVACVRQLILSGGAHQVATVNGAMLVRAARDPRTKALLNAATLATPDGAGVLLAGKILGVRFPERVAGIDLVAHVCAMAAREGFRLYLFGAAPGVAEAAAAALRTRSPGLEIAGVRHGYLQDDDEAVVLAQIRGARPHLLLVGLGSPRQEEWIVAHRERLAPVVCIGVGGAFDVLAGRQRRAPLWMQRWGLEWAYRLIREPKRWRVIATLPLLVWFALKARVGKWWPSRSG